jgi:RNA polymerase sigma-70 factor (ECF subfamily)
MASEPGPEGSTSSSLLQRVREGDQDAWSRLVAWAGPLVLYWCRQAGVPPEDRDDLFQEVFLAVSSHVARFRRDRPGDSFRGWLLTITRSKMADLARRRLQQPRAVGGSQAYQRLLEVGEQPEALPPSEPPSGVEVAGGSASCTPPAGDPLLQGALAALRPEFEERSWQAFWRTAVDGLSAPEAAAELGMTPAAVRKARSRVLARLRQEFGGLLE